MNTAPLRGLDAHAADQNSGEKRTGRLASSASRRGCGGYIRTRSPHTRAAAWVSLRALLIFFRVTSFIQKQLSFESKRAKKGVITLLLCGNP